MHFRSLLLLLLLLLDTLLFAQPGKRTTVVTDTVVTQNGSITELVVTARNFKKILHKRNGLLHGSQETYNASGALTEKLQYEYGLLSGEQLAYDSYNMVAERRFYQIRKNEKRSLLQGKKTNYRNGIRIAEYTYKDSIKNGPFALYYENGKTQEEGNNKNGFPYGKDVSYYPDGTQKSEKNYTEAVTENGKEQAVLHGVLKEYNSQGVLTHEGTFVNGKKEGVFASWDPVSKKLTEKTAFKDGKKHGAYEKYAKTGELLSKGIYYEEIVVNGVLLKGVYDGLIEEYSANGKPEFSKSYKMGVLDGDFRVYDKKGNLQSVRHYTDGLETGVSVYYSQGIKSMETNFGIIEKDGKKISVKQGEETCWTNGVVVSKTFYKDGKQQGTATTYFSDGAPESVKNFENGLLKGLYLNYFKNGKLQTRKQYVLEKKFDGSYKSSEYGWSETFDEQERITVKRYNMPNEYYPVTQLYTDGVLQQYIVATAFETSYSPEGKINALKILGSRPGATRLEFYFYRSGGLRKLKSDDFATAKQISYEVNDKGEVVASYDESYPDAKGIKANAVPYVTFVNDEWTNAPLLKPDPKDGTYKLNYSNGKVFLMAGFKNSLPHGDFTVFEPVKGDTLYAARFKNGIPNGRFVEKFAGKTVVVKGKFHENGQVAERYTYRNNGLPMYYVVNDTLGRVVIENQYYENGKPKSRVNYPDKTSVYYDDGGLITQEYARVSGNPDLLVSREFYPKTKQLKRERFMSEKGAEGSDTGYHPNGKLQFKQAYLNNKREGNYTLYDEKGNLLKEGTYLDNEMDGKWTTYTNGKTEVSYYIKGRRKVETSEKNICSCADTLMPQNKIRFAPSLSSLTSYKSVLKYLPPYLIPVDELNYNSIFYIGLQTSGDSRGGFAGMKLLANKPFTFYLPADKQVKLTMNPCVTTGYISSMELNSNFSYNNEEESYTSLYPRRIKLELMGGPLKSTSNEYVNFTMLYNVREVSLNRWEFKIQSAVNPGHCYTPGRINNFVDIVVDEAAPWLFRTDMSLGTLPVLWSSGGASVNESDSFFGINVTKGTATFPLSGSDKTVRVNAYIADMYAGAKFVTGVLYLPCSLHTNDKLYTYNISGTTITFSAEEVIKQWEKKGFSRLNAEYDKEKQALKIIFFAR